jgi:hypothetical protein
MQLRAEERQKRDAARKKLEEDIVAGRVQVIRKANGEFAISNWQAQQAAVTGWCEGCVLRTIQQKGSWVAKQKLAQAGLTKKPFVAATHRGHSH